MKFHFELLWSWTAAFVLAGTGSALVLALAALFWLRSLR